jgi:hypothetical protein
VLEVIISGRILRRLFEAFLTSPGKGWGMTSTEIKSPLQTPFQLLAIAASVV